MKTHEYFPEDFLENTEDVYQAVMVIAKRARQISELQKRLIDRHLGQTEMLEQAAARARSEDSDDNLPEPEPIDRPVPRFPKPVELSMQEMREQKIDFRYE